MPGSWNRNVVQRGIALTSEMWRLKYDRILRHYSSVLNDTNERYCSNKFAHYSAVASVVTIKILPLFGLGINANQSACPPRSSIQDHLYRYIVPAAGILSSGSPNTALIQLIITQVLMRLLGLSGLYTLCTDNIIDDPHRYFIDRSWGGRCKSFPEHVCSAGASLNELPPKNTTIGPPFSGHLFLMSSPYRTTTVIHLHAPRKLFPYVTWGPWA